MPFVAKMRFLLIAGFLCLVPGTALGDSNSNSDCLKALQRCYDLNVYAIERKLETAELGPIKDACMLYSGALQCMDNLPCDKTSTYNNKMRDLKKDLEKKTKAICSEEGELDDCFYALLYCEGVFEQADQDLKTGNASAGCLEVVVYEKCTDAAKQTCPDFAVTDVYANWEPLNKDAHKQGCDVGCSKALEQCTYELDVSDPNSKTEYCTALSDTQTCLKKTQEDIECTSEDSQKYLAKAKKQKASKYASVCGNGVTATASISVLMILVTMTTALITSQASH